jgi:O-antigen/teichoic acid export membrane protein
MTETGHIAATRPLARLGDMLAARRDVVRGYLAAVSGSAGRLVFSLIYFVALANALSIQDFGRFATASAAGVMLSRIVGVGFISALYRTATVRPRLIGVFTGGFLLLTLLSLPLLALASTAVYLIFFAGEVSPATFALVIAAETLLWRPFETVVIVNNGLGRFGRAALLVIIGTLFRAAAACVFILAAQTSLEFWSYFYLAANAATLILAAGWFYPRQRPRLKIRLYWRRLPDSLYVAGAEMLFYLQMELDKLLVLAMGGPTLAGIYAIVMRLVDLTAIPIRTFSMMLVQKMMRRPELLAGLKVKGGIEAGIFVVSTLGLAALAAVLWFFPTALGGNVAEAAPLVGLALFVPGFRNLVEYQAELLFARGQTLIRAVNLALLAAVKAGLLAYVLSLALAPDVLVLWLNAVFLGLYLVSALATYAALKRPAKPV